MATKKDEKLQISDLSLDQNAVTQFRGLPTTQQEGIPTWDDIKALTNNAEKVLYDTNTKKTPEAFLLPIISLMK